MSKELKALKRIEKRIYGDIPETGAVADDDLHIIETALEDYQLHKEILNDYGFTLVNFREACFLLAQFRGSGYTGIENKLKALEIIKKKNVNVKAFLLCCDNKSGILIYNSLVRENQQFTQEEYNLLKEVFKNE